MSGGVDELEERLRAVRVRIDAACQSADRDPFTVQLLPISKKQPLEKLRAAHQLGIRELGESRVQELTARAEELAELSFAWHMIGSLQTNKVKQLLRAPGLHLLHSVDRLDLVLSLQRHLDATGRELAVLLQVNATGEANKHGVVPAAAFELLQATVQDAPCLKVHGLMAMGPLSGDPQPVFERVAMLIENLRQQTGLALPVMSLGMTGDLEAAVQAGSTLIRVGTGVFGPRP